MKDGIISIGFDKNGDADFGVNASIMDLTLDQMNELRRMIPVAIGTAEDMFRRSRQDQNACNQNTNPHP